MSLPAIILQADELVVTQSDSIFGIQFDDAPFIYGSIEKISDLMDSYSVGQNVGFNPDGATKFIYSSTNYYLIKQSAIKFNEGVPV